MVGKTGGCNVVPAAKASVFICWMSASVGFVCCCVADGHPSASPRLFMGVVTILLVWFARFSVDWAPSLDGHPT